MRNRAGTIPLQDAVVPDRDGVGLFLLGITRDREGDRKHLLGIVRDPGGSYPFAEVGVRYRAGIVPV